MNKKQKNTIIEVLEQLHEILSSEEEKLDNMEEKFSETERFLKMSENKDCLEEAISVLESIELD